MYEWFISSLFFMVIWLVIFISRPRVRKEMFWISLSTMPLGLTEPLFIPAYWSPPSLFDLAKNTGFDVESLIFAFTIGGIVAVIYESLFGTKHFRLTPEEVSNKRHKFHILVLASPILTFIPLYFLTTLNPIYSASITLFVSGIATLLCRPDLKKEILTGAILFTVIYFVLFLGINLFFPSFTNSWNFSEISGILVVGVPLEELMFAFVFGMMWSSLYEHVLWYRVLKKAAD